MEQEQSGCMTLRDIRKYFAAKDVPLCVLGGISLTVKPKEFICVMGPSGCGKSTLIRIMEGIEKPDSGAVYLNKQEISRTVGKSVQRKFGIVFQNDNLLEWKTVYKNVELPLSVFHLMNGIPAMQRVMKMLELVGLQDFKDCLPHELSGGMRQRTAIARALVSDPEFLMLDQPFGALDAITRKMLNVELLRIWHETGKTCIMITNNVNEALYLGTRILFLSDAPAVIMKEVNVPFTYEQKISGIGTVPEYLALRSELNRLVRRSVKPGEVLCV